MPRVVNRIGLVPIDHLEASGPMAGLHHPPPAEAALTEIPEHLLARSRAARAKASGGAVEAAPTASAPATAQSAAPATAAAAAPAAAAAAPAPAKVEPKLPMVEAAERRTKIPVWVMPVLAFLPIWAIMYMTTNDMPSVKKAGPLTSGATVYSNCASCHGATGAGAGAFPQLNEGAVLATFPKPGDQVRWVLLGSAGYQAEGATAYGATDKPIKGGMPGWESLTADELLNVIRHERETLSGEEFDATAWEEAVTTLEADPNPAVADKAAEFAAVLEEWATATPGT